MSNYKTFLASNTPPPSWFIYDDKDYINGIKEVKRKEKELEGWDFTRFVSYDGKFIPLVQQEREKKIEDFNFIIRL